jgi:hypothetical protein
VVRITVMSSIREEAAERVNRVGGRYICDCLPFGCRLGGTREAAMCRENHVAKQERIGERLTRAMAKAHIDRRELAALTGYSEAQIVLWERGCAELYPAELIKLCHALDVMPEWLLCWERRNH